MTSSRPEKVFPAAPPAPASPGAGGGGGLGGLRRVDKKVWMGAGAVVVAGVALFAGSRGGSSQENPYELDTTATDLYTDLQPELEGISDGLDDISGQLEDLDDDDVLSDPTGGATPKAPKPKPAKRRKPRKNKPGPKPNRPRGPRGQWEPPGQGKGPKGGKGKGPLKPPPVPNGPRRGGVGTQPRTTTKATRKVPAAPRIRLPKRKR